MTTNSDFKFRFTEGLFSFLLILTDGYVSDDSFERLAIGLVLPRGTGWVSVTWDRPESAQCPIAKFVTRTLTWKGLFRINDSLSAVFILAPTFIFTFFTLWPQVTF